MAAYTCEKCGMSVGTMTCGQCGTELVHGTLVKEDGSSVHVSTCIAIASIIAFKTIIQPIIQLILIMVMIPLSMSIMPLRGAILIMAIPVGLRIY